MERFRHEVERSDYFKGAVLMHSLAGGTGSGLGSRLLESIRTDYPNAFLTTVSIFPNKGGEVPLQNFNTTFATSYLQEFADAILFFENDRILSTLYQAVKSTFYPSTACMNEYIA
jgi:hypothetical protein